MSEWRETTLGEVGRFVRGRRFTKNEYVESGLGCIHYGQVHTHFGPIATESLTFLPETARSRSRLASPGNVVIAATSENIEDLGKATVWLGADDVAVHDDCYIFQHTLDPRFASYLFASSAFHRQKVQYAAGTKVTRISGAALAKIRVAVPPLAEQHRIVDVMVAVDAQIGALDKEAEAIASVLRGARNNLGAMASSMTLRDLAAGSGIQIGPFGSQLHAREYTEEGTPVVMPQDLINGEISSVKIKRVPEEVAERLGKHRLRAGDIVFPRRGDLSKRALVRADQEGWLCGTGCLRFRPREREQAARLAEALAGDPTSDWLTENAVGTTMLNLNTEILSKLPVADIVDHHELADACINLQAAHRQTLCELEALRAFRSTLLTSLLNQAISIPESYDTLLEQGMEVAS